MSPVGAASAALQKAWLKRGLLACLLWPVSQLYRAVSALRTQLYRSGVLESTPVGVPVIVVGNVVVGGAGKTPLIIALAEHLTAIGIAAGVVSRGYGRSSEACLEVTPGSTLAEAGDEPLLIRRRTGVPVFVARQRVDAARALLAAYPATRVLLCDDGLQHHALQRDLEIVVFDDRGVGNGWLVPAGPLRESWPSNRPASNAPSVLVLHTGHHPAFDGFRSSRRLADHAIDATGRKTSLAGLVDRRLVATAGIANPEVFFEMLRAGGLSLEETRALPDHDDFSGFSFAGLDGATLLCTEKDAVKLFSLPKTQGTEVLAVPLVFSAEPAFMQAFNARLAALLP
ncbi:MAG: tetraacyldisaccharide 4'-kinase [Comamonadaceae bacterium]|nr:MAG: tetraacyldisaccharide 4'-kinase [Comamonadaceae bacterium]